MVVADLRVMKLEAGVSELEAGRLRVGMPAQVTVQARPGENGVITSTELNDARLSLLETEWELMQAKYGQIVAAARTRFAAGL